MYTDQINLDAYTSSHQDFVRSGEFPGPADSPIGPLDLQQAAATKALLAAANTVLNDKLETRLDAFRDFLEERGIVMDTTTIKRRMTRILLQFMDANDISKDYMTRRMLKPHSQLNELFSLILLTFDKQAQ